MKCTTALVTGASRGIGLAAARGLARHGCRRILLLARSQDKLRTALEDVSRYGAEATPIIGDLTRPGEIEGKISGAIREYNGLSHVFMSFGNPSCEPCLPLEASYQDWIQAFNMYVLSVVAVARALVAENPGKAMLVVFSSFTVKESGHNLLTVADVVRAGLPVLLRRLARIHPDKLQTILVELGSFPTPGAEETIRKVAERLGVDSSELWRREIVLASPLKRPGSLGELEELVAVLVSAPEYLTGTVIRFDGGSGACL